MKFVKNKRLSFNKVIGPYLNVSLQIERGENPLVGVSPLLSVRGVPVPHAGRIRSSSPVTQICYKGNFLFFNTGSIPQ